MSPVQFTTTYQQQGSTKKAQAWSKVKTLQRSEVEVQHGDAVEAPRLAQTSTQPTAHEPPSPAERASNAHPKVEEEPRRARYRGTVEQIEDESPANGISKSRLVLDCVSVPDLEDAMRNPRPWRRFPVAYLLLVVNDAKGVLTPMLDESGWLNFTLSDRPLDEQSLRAQTLLLGTTDEPPTTLWLSSPSAASGREVADTSALWPVEHLVSRKTPSRPPLSRGEKKRPSYSIAVYDVGQASMAAVVNEFEHPVAYLDMGWPISFYNESAPTIPSFKLLGGKIADKAPVILSHLDWDHWAYAIESGKVVFDAKNGSWKAEPVYREEVIGRPWYMRPPRPSRHRLGPSHAHLVQTLRARKLRYFDETKGFTRWGPVNVIRCDSSKAVKSPAYLRNNEGLAVLLSTRQGRVLICGDADFPSIPARFMQRLDGMVAPHHGGDITLDAMPKPRKDNAPMAVSVGDGCYSNVPSFKTHFVAVGHGWKWHETTQRSRCGRCGATKGHISLTLGTPPRCTCLAVPNSGLCLNVHP